MKNLSNAALYRVFLPFAAGYFISYHFRVVNAVLAPNLVADLGIGPASLGLLSSVYFIAFASFQLPLGVLLDRYGPRRTEGVLLLFAALGAFIFGRAESLAGLVAGRALIGFGVSACLMAAFKAYTVWFDRKNWPLINGCQMASGGLGALVATSPVEMLLGYTDWRTVFYLLALATLGVALLIFFVVPEQDKKPAAESLASQLGGIKEVFSSLTFWQIAPLVSLSQASFLSIQGLWAGPWLRDVIGLSRAAAAALLFWVAVSMIIGWIVSGWSAGRLAARGISLMTTTVSYLCIFIILQILVMLVPVSWNTLIWCLFGFVGVTPIIAYAALSQFFPLNLSGRVTTGVNLLVFVAAFSGQWVIGAIIEQWPIGADGSYHVQGFRYGFSLMIALQIAALVWYFLAGRIIKTKQQEKNETP